MGRREGGREVSRWKEGEEEGERKEDRQERVSLHLCTSVCTHLNYTHQGRTQEFSKGVSAQRVPRIIGHAKCFIHNAPGTPCKMKFMGTYVFA